MGSATGSPSLGGQPAARRVDWLDGVRGAAAMFVVLHHTWLGVWSTFPRNVGPWWLGWLLYGHLAVAVFIVVSGFSLSLAPVRRGDTLAGGPRRFLRRRAWRILPPYWAALIFSTLITWLVLVPSTGTGTVTRGFVVHGLLLQDITGSWVPNGAFWSIAVEWQIYFVFPLILLLARRTSIATSVASVVALVLVAQRLTTLGSPLTKISHLTPQLLALFALGVLAAHVGHERHGAKAKRALMTTGLAALGCVVLAALLKGSVWVVDRYFWIDLVFGAGVACVMAVMYAGGAAHLRRLLASRVMLRLGLFSYSIYLLHGPLLGVIDEKIVGPMHLAPLATFGLLIAIGVPIVLVACYGFHLMFEAPFLNRRGFDALRTLPIVTKLSRRATVRAPQPGAEVVAAHEQAT